MAIASVPVELTCGVPQGSICGPSQFTAYTEDIQDVITLDYHLYADDTQLIAKSTVCSVDVTCRRLESCVASVQRWCASRRLQLNADKTELMWLGSAVNLEHLQTDPVGLTIAGVNVKAVDCVRDLGVHLDSRLDPRTHSSRIVSTCYFHVRRLRHLHHIVSQETRQHLVSAFSRGLTMAMSSLLVYQGSLWHHYVES